MSLDNATTGVTSQLPTDKVNSTTNTVKKTPKKLNKPTKDITDQTKDLTSQSIPGEFPSDNAPPKGQNIDNNLSFSSIWTTITTWFATLFPKAFDYFDSCLQRLMAWILPPPRQAAMYEAALKRPAATTFIVCQMICCGVPLFVFLAGVFVFAAVAVLLWAVLSVLVLGPVLLVTKVLGGVITRFWLSKVQEGEGEGDGDSDGEDAEKQGKQEGKEKPKKQERKDE
ncbi:uncharacterized protein N7515_002333 [Penicillium bovifimosum]|uniref:Transmembrane protein n=1 Tax=Penicillium bovifimosum TaxID=126998 RepID=A0A9W9HBD7_9EURO|nr:uncharacterized protein N7515_002333 [Penicillium bovifimosum]KAJ5143546.1 hypothetical protein N7515_002333 [Penicillium bovifimosum]